MADGRRVRRWWRPDPFDVAVLAAFGGLSVWVLAILALRSGPDHLWLGTDGPFIGDQMQYLGFVQDAARHVLVANPFRSVRPAGVYLHPGLVLSGLLVRAGASPAAAYLAWKPVAVLGLFAAVRGYTRSLLTGRAARRVALVLALFAISPTAVLLQHAGGLAAHDRVALQAMASDLWPGLYLWGYPFTALAVAALPAALLAYGRDRADGRIRGWAPAAGLVCAWLQPWQGATLLGVLVVSEAVLWRRGRRPWRLLAINAAAVAAPLLYYFGLSRLDATWAHAGRANLVTFPWPPLALTLAPLALLALVAYRRRPRSFAEVAVRVWPAAGLAVYAVITVGHVGTFPLHALQGLGIPLAVLSVDGARSLRAHLGGPPLLWGAAAGVTALAVAAAFALQLDSARSIGRVDLGQPGPYYLTAGEHAALVALRRDPTPGAVLAPVGIGETVPAETGRQTWVGVASWTPHFHRRVVQADQLFSGLLAPPAARRLVLASRARFLVSDCAHHAPLAGELGPLVVQVRHFGCATVYRLGRSG